MDLSAKNVFQYAFGVLLPQHEGYGNFREGAYRRSLGAQIFYDHRLPDNLLSGEFRLGERVTGMPGSGERAEEFTLAFRPDGVSIRDGLDRPHITNEAGMADRISYMRGQKTAPQLIDEGRFHFSGRGGRSMDDVVRGFSGRELGGLVSEVPGSGKFLDDVSICTGIRTGDVYSQASRVFCDRYFGNTYVIGGGAVGGSIAAFASSAGIPGIYVVEAGERAKRLKADGGVSVAVKNPDGSYTTGFHNLDVLDTGEFGDHLHGGNSRVLLCVKGHYAEDALRPLMGRDCRTPVANCMNGRVDIGRFVPQSTPVYRALIEYGATCDDDGIKVTTTARMIKLGPAQEDYDAEHLHLYRLVLGQVADATVFPCQKMAELEAAKYVFNCAFNATSAITGKTFGQIAGDPWASRLFRDLYVEAHDQVVSRGERIGPLGMIPGDDTTYRLLKTPVARGLFMSAMGRVIGDMFSSMAQDLENGRRTEIDFLTGQIDGPVSRKATGIIRDLERRVYAPLDATVLYA